MKFRVVSFVLGFGVACLLGVALVGGFFFLSGGDSTPLAHDVVLPSGKSIKVMSCNFVWGSEHSERSSEKDCFALEYVTSLPATSDRQLKDREAVEAFELIRPPSEQWGLAKAEMHAFPTTKRKGAYDIYLFTRQADGKWTFAQSAAKVFAND